MTEMQQILEAIKKLQKGQESIRDEMATKSELAKMATKSDLQEIKQVLAHTNTALEALAEGQREIRETMATKADVLDLGVKLNKNHTETKIRLKNLEEHTGTTDPTKN